MNQNVFFLFKKEIRDYLYSYKCLLAIAIISLYPVLWRAKGKVMPEVLYIAFFQMVQGQFIYDSFLMDTKEKGSLFFINMKLSFEIQYIIKAAIAFLQIILCVIINYKDIVLYFTFIDLLWIIPLLVHSSLMMYVGSVLTDGAELSTAFVISGIIFVLTYLILLSSLIIRILVTCGLSILLFLIAKKLFYSKKYRIEI